MGAEGLLARTECSIVNESIPLIYIVVLECTWACSPTTDFLCFALPFSAACAYWSDCHWAVPSDTRSLPWVVTIHTSCSFIMCGQFKLCFLLCVTFHLSPGDWSALMLWVGAPSLIRDLRKVILFYSVYVPYYCWNIFHLLLIFTNH